MVMADMELGVMMRINLQWKDSRLHFRKLDQDLVIIIKGGFVIAKRHHPHIHFGL